MLKPVALGLDQDTNPIDRHVGVRIRLRRKELGISQGRLAEALGLTFQQVQKYERATNRVSASKLFEVARALSVQPSFFFDGLEELDGGEWSAGSGSPEHEFLISPEGIELARTFSQLPRTQRRKVVELIRILAEQAPEVIGEAAE